MATLEEFKALRAGAAPEVQTELYGLMTSDPEAGKQRIGAAAQGVTLTTEEVRGFLLQMDEEEELTTSNWMVVAAVAGGQPGNKRKLLIDDHSQRLQSSPRFSPT